MLEGESDKVEDEGNDGYGNVAVDDASHEHECFELHDRSSVG